MDNTKSLFIPVILGTPRQACMSAHVANFVYGETKHFPGIETELIDVAKLDLPTNNAGEDIKEAEFSAACNKADAFIIVVPEYNHGYPGLLKHALDTNLKEYVHKAVGIVGVSAGPFGGTRVIQNLIPVMRELGLVSIFWDVNFGQVQKSFDENGTLLDQSYHHRFEKFVKELVWMGKVLRYGRENVSQD